MTRRLRLGIGALMQESNSFSAGRSMLREFENRYLLRGSEVVETLAGSSTEIGGALRALAGQDVEVVPLLATNGGSGPIVAADCHRALRDEMLARLAEAGPLDALYLALHGAMAAEDEFDVEGALLDAVRRIVGAIPLGITLDLHAHVTPRMIGKADVVIGYKHYPHDDAPEAAAHCVALILRMRRDGLKPVMRLAKVPALFAPHLERTDGAEPLAAFNAWARAQERAGRVLSASYFPVQPWLDVPEMGFAAVAVAEDAAEAEAVAGALADMAWERRRAFTVPTVDPAAAIAAGRALAGGPVILADTADCVGGGSTGDSAVVLAALLAAGGNDAAAIMVVDPETVSAAAAAGIGATCDFAIGHRIDLTRGAPVPLRARVEHLFDGRFRYQGGVLGGVEATMGPSAVLAAGAIRVLVASYPSYEWACEQYGAAGIDVGALKFVVVKNPMNYKLTMPCVAAMVLETPGPASPNLRALTWRHLRRPFFPLDEDCRDAAG